MAVSLRFDKRTRQFWIRIPKAQGGGSKWFGTDPASAKLAYEAWTKAAETANAPTPAPRVLSRSRKLARTAGGNGCSTAGMLAALETSPSVQQTAQELFALVDSESGPAGQANIRWRLKGFIGRLGGRPIASLKAADLIAYKASLNCSPEYKNNQLVAVRRLLRFAIDCGYAGSFPLGLLKPVPLGAVKRKGIAAAKFAVLLKEVAKRNRPLASMMLVQFYQTLRPSETPKVMHSLGELQSDGFTLAISSKTTRKSGELRPVVLLPESQELIAEFIKMKRAKYQTMNAYRLACNVVGRSIGKDKLRALIGQEVLSPHFIRATSNQALRDARINPQDRDIAMGRLESKVERRYGVDREFSQTRENLRVLTRIVPTKTVK